MITKLRSKTLLVLAAGIICFSCGRDSSISEAPGSLVVSEGFENPIGFYDNEPSFSWKLPDSETIKSQTGYRIVAASNSKLLPKKADLWDSGEVSSDQSAWIEYDGTPLISRQKSSILNFETIQRCRLPQKSLSPGFSTQMEFL